MSTESELPAPRRSNDIRAAILVVVYFIAVFAIGAVIGPPNRWWYLGVSLMPGLAAIVWCLPSVIRNRAIGLIAILYLIVLPVLAAIFIGPPGAFVLFQASKIFGS